MNGLSKWKVALYLAIIFFAGAVSGWFVGTKTVFERMFAVPRMDEFTKSMNERLQSDLNLSETQAKRVAAVIERASGEMQTVHENHLKRIRQIIDNRNIQIAALLSPEQKAIFEQKEKERAEARKDWESRRGKFSGKDWRHGPPKPPGSTNREPYMKRGSRTNEFRSKQISTNSPPPPPQ